MSNLPEIQGWFVPRTTPYGTAPEHIKEQWVGVPLPLRQLGSDETPRVSIGHDLGNVLGVHITENPANVYGADALKALRIFDRDEAADFWDAYVYPDDTLTFRHKEGQFYPTAEIQRILPGIELFDITD